LHLDQHGYEVFFDDLDDTGRDKCEKEADAMAQEALIPARLWKASGLTKHAPAEAVVRLASQLRINPAIPAGRVRHERQNFFMLKNLIGQGKVRCVFSEGKN
jgi:HTH-type transcriptional regulator/antitoxin HigA